MTRKKVLLLAGLAGACVALSGCATTASYNQRYNPEPFTAEATVTGKAHTPGQYVTQSTVYGGYILNTPTYSPARWDVHVRTDTGYMATCSVSEDVHKAVNNGMRINVTLKQKSAAFDFECVSASVPQG